MDYWLVRRTSFSDEYVEQTWVDDFQPEADAARRQLRQGIQPALAQLLDRCAAVTVSNLVMVQAACILDTPVYLRPVVGP